MRQTIIRNSRVYNIDADQRRRIIRDSPSFLFGGITMSGYYDFTEEQKQRANSVDLVDYLRRRGEKLTRSGHDWRWERHDSVTVQGSSWYRHSTKEGGHAIDFVQEFYDLSFPEAMMELLGGINGVEFRQEDKTERPERKPFELPEANSDMHRVFAYLLKQRFLDRDVLISFAKQKMIYEDKKYHNAVFVGCDEKGIARHAHKKGTCSEGKSYRVNVEGSDPRYSFHYIGTDDTLYVFEAPIDMLSYITLHKDNWQAHSYVALNGVGEQAMLHILDTNSQIKKVMLCFDHDPAGIELSDKLKDLLGEREYEQIFRLESVYKDWNEDIKAQNGVTPLPAKEHPRIIAFEEMCVNLIETGGNPSGSLNPQYALMEYMKGLRPFLQNGIVPAGTESTVMKHLQNISVNALLSAGREYRQLGQAESYEQLVKQMHGSYHVYQDRSGLRNKARDIQNDVAMVVQKFKLPGIRSAEDKQNLIKSYMSLALDCVKAHISVNLEQQKQMNSQTNQTANFNMAM